MTTALWIAAVLLWIAWSAQAILSAMQVRKFSRRFEQPRREGFDRYRPPAAVIVPCKGLDVDLASNVRRLCAQDYPDYRLLLTVESRQDPAYAVLEREISQHDQRRVDIIVAGAADRHEGQKVHNLLAAVRRLGEEDAGEQVWVFADSDAVMGASWLGDLVGPLVQAQTGVTTGYRWLVPEAVQGHASVWAGLASVLNSSVTCFYGRDDFNQAWGGSMAMRVEVARDGDLVGYWRGAISDDYQVSTMCRRLGLRIYFVPRCLVATPVAIRFGQLVNFAYRQYVITRIHAPKLFVAALGFHCLFLAGFLSAWFTLLWVLLRNPADWTGWVLPAAAHAIVFGANQARANFRRRVVQRAFGSPALNRLSAALRLDRWGTPLWMAVHFMLILSSVFGRTITWRSICYRIHGPKQIEQVDQGTAGDRAAQGRQMHARTRGSRTPVEDPASR